MKPSGLVLLTTFLLVAASAGAGDGEGRFSVHADTYCLMWERAGDGPAIVDGSIDRAARP